MLVPSVLFIGVGLFHFFEFAGFFCCSIAICVGFVIRIVESRFSWKVSWVARVFIVHVCCLDVEFRLQ